MPTFVSQTLQQMRYSSFTCTLSYSLVVFISYMFRLDVDALLNVVFSISLGYRLRQNLASN
jgi:hypothetical protein